jgi:uncharacterized tellurite resistance protein B-like protein
MNDLLRRLLGKVKPKGSAETKEPDLRDIQTATCALFLEMARTDGEFDESEQDRVLSILRNDYDLSEEDALALIEETNHELEQSIDLWQFTKRINLSYSKEEKVRVIRMLWQIVYADGTLDKHEHYLVRKLSKLLRLSHEELIDAKLSVIRGGDPLPT